jgi:hypothetical protein
VEFSPELRAADLLNHLQAKEALLIEPVACDM